MASNAGSSKNSLTSSSKGKAKADKKITEVSEDQIEQFCSITGSDDKELAKSLIAACYGNLEVAINMQLEGTTSSVASGEQPSTSTSQDEVRAPIPQKQEVLVESNYSDYSFGFRGRRRAVPTVFDGFRNFEVESRLQEDLLNQTDPAGFAQKRKTLEDLFRPPLDLMFRGNLHSARDAGTAASKWLMVNVQNVTEFACQALNRDLWSNAAVKSIVKEHFIFWQVHSAGEEGQRFMTFYPVTKWPHVAILDPRTGECLRTYSNVDAVTFCDVISQFLEENPWDHAVNKTEDKEEQKRKRKWESLIDDSEDAQMEAAIRASLTETEFCTRMKKLKTSNDTEEDSSEESDLEAFESDSESQEKSSGTNDTAKEKETDLETEKDVPTTNGEKVEGGESWRQYLGVETDPCSSVQFRFPDGTKTMLSLPCSSSVKALVSYAACKGFPSDKYELVANFPRRLLSETQDQTLKEVGLYPQDTVFLQAR